MLKITVREETSGATLEVEGRLAGPWVDELDRAWRNMPDPRPGHPIVDLSGVTFIDGAGKALLARLWKDGAKLQAAGCLTRCIVEEITTGAPSDSCQATQKEQR
ncbi:MAG: anti-sigma factor antagonist [Nitrospirae bacterium]|nr:MAG: anti-sigma factor antagonist [Nitrospirota bacterium]